jgi:serine phosphatase RsbU (regulator of sigma subunit)
MDMARNVQRSFLPSIPDSVNGVRMLAEYRPAYDIGGDFYDLIHLGPDRFLVVIGDVSGKGVAAALMMSRIISEFRRAAIYCESPDEILVEVNDFMTSQPFQDCFVTATCIDVNSKARTISVANAGHVPPVLRRRFGDTALLGEASGAPLGLLEGETYRCDSCSLEADDIILLVTDGITEALEPLADPAASGVLTRMVANTAHDIHALKTRILGALTDDAPRRHRADDVALFAMQMA